MILTPEERKGAIQYGMIRKLASMGIGPGEFMRRIRGMDKQAGILSSPAKDTESVIKTLLTLAGATGIGIGTLDYALRTSLKPRRKSNRKSKAVLDQYNDIVAQYKRRLQEEQEANAALKLASCTEKSASTDSFSEKYPIWSMGAGGLLVGGAAAGISALISDYIEAKRQAKKKKEREGDTISPDTVVLYLKNREKLAQASDIGHKVRQAEPKEARTPSVKIEPTVVGKSLKYTPGVEQPRETNGRYSTLSKKAFSFRGAFNEGAGLATFIGALPIGYAVIDTIHNKLEEKRLKRQIAAAQKEYIDLLDNPEKQAEADPDCKAFLDMIGFDYDLQEKTAAGEYQPRTPLGHVAKGVGSLFPEGFGTNLQHITGGGIATAILTAAAAEYITRKLLEKKFDTPEAEEEEPKKVTRILFKGASCEQEISPEQLLFTVMMWRNAISNGYGLNKLAAAPVSTNVNGNAIEINDPAVIQYFLDRYAQNTFGYKGGNTAHMPRGVETVAAAANPRTWNLKSDKALANTEAIVMDYMKRNPDKWFGLLGEEKNRGLLESGVNYWLNTQNNFLGTLSRIPILGDFIQYLVRQYAMKTSAGQRMAARVALKNLGIEGEKAERYLDNWILTPRGWVRKQQPTPPRVRQDQTGQTNMAGGAADQALQAGRTPSIERKTNTASIADELVVPQPTAPKDTTGTQSQLKVLQPARPAVTLATPVQQQPSASSIQLPFDPHDPLGIKAMIKRPVVQSQVKQPRRGNALVFR